MAKPMPEYWYDKRDNLIKDGDTEDVIKQKQFNQTIAAPNKPYFMIYVYPDLKKRFSKYMENTNNSAIMNFNDSGIHNVDDLYACTNKSDDMIRFLKSYENDIPVSMNDCVVNRICSRIESQFDGYIKLQKSSVPFNYEILKNDSQYSAKSYRQIKSLYDVYREKLRILSAENKSQKFEEYQFLETKHILLLYFVSECSKICPNDDELCNILLDLCYTKDGSKQFVWDVCGQTIIKYLLIKYDAKIHYPKLVDSNEEFEYCGNKFVLEELEVDNAYSIE